MLYLRYSYLIVTIRLRCSYVTITLWLRYGDVATLRWRMLRLNSIKLHLPYQKQIPRYYRNLPYLIIHVILSNGSVWFWGIHQWQTHRWWSQRERTSSQGVSRSHQSRTWGLPHGWRNTGKLVTTDKFIKYKYLLKMKAPPKVELPLEHKGASAAHLVSAWFSVARGPKFNSLSDHLTLVSTSFHSVYMYIALINFKYP